MGGFEVATTGNVLDFTGTKYEGLEVTTDEAPLGVLLDVMEDFARLEGRDVDVPTAARVLASLTKNFAQVLEEWNATRKGVPVPPTEEGLRSLGSAFVMDVVRAWLTGTAAPDDDLGKDSPSGETSPEELTAAAGLSRSLPSS